MKKFSLVLLSLGFMLTACQQEQKPENPFFTEFNTPYGVPPFDRIDDEHYLPAFEEAIARHEADIEAIVANTEAPTFENTIVAYDRSGEMLSRVSPVFGGVRGANTNPRLQEIAREVTPMLSSHSNKIRFNQELFARIKAVYDQRESLDLNNEQMRVVEKIYNDFARNGAALPEAEREELKALNEKIP